MSSITAFMKSIICTMIKQPVIDYYEMGTGIVAFSSTRHGGCSKGNYAGFNINRYCGDNEEDVCENRRALCQTLGISDDHLILPHQVHGTRTVMIDRTFLALSAIERQKALEGVDALMTNLQGVCIGVSTADCIPVLLFDMENRAVCAIHAGWRGTVKRIAVKALQAMSHAYGTQPQQVIAQIGPGIHLDSFEVGDEVYDAFTNEGFHMPAISKRYLSYNGTGEKWHIDLPNCNRLQLLSAGLESPNIKVSTVCTFQQADDYFSARRLGISSGRIFSGVMMTYS